MGGSGGKGGKGGGRVNPSQIFAQAGMTDAQGQQAMANYLQDYQDVARSGMDPLTHYLRHGQGEGRKLRYDGMPGSGGGGGGGAGLIFSGISGGSSAAEDALKKQQEEQARLAEEARINEGRRQRDALYNQRMDAASSAADFIGQQIKQEGDRARLLGLDYSVTDEQRQSRINDYFATMWGAGSESQLEKLMGEFGTPKGFEGFTTVRGDGGNVSGGAIGAEDVVGSTGGVRPQQTALTDQEDELLGGTATALG